MTIDQLEGRIINLERQVAELRNQVTPLPPMRSVQETFGMFANDLEFDEIVELGREFRRQENAEGWS